MSLIFQNISAGAAAGTKATGANSSIAASTSTAGANGTANFGFSLAQFMAGGNAQEASAMNGAGTLLEGLLQNALTSAGEGEGDNQDQVNADLLQNILGDTEKLDEAIAADPEVMVALQSWIQQVTALLNNLAGSGGETAGTGEEAGNAEANTLADHPATIRFAVQDTLAQLVSKLQHAETSGDIPVQAVQLLESFQNILQETALTGRSKTDVSQSTSSAQSSSKETVQTVQTSGDAQVSNRLAALLDGILKNQSTDSTLSTQPAPILVKASAGEKASVVPVASIKIDQSSGDEQETSKSDDLLVGQSTVTAGHLFMKEGIHSPLKAAAPAVPVQDFAKEMSGFVVSKLDIVKQQGISEAKISLYPEHLGQVDIKLTMQNGQLIAQFTAEHAGTKDLLEQQMSQLRSSLQSQGVQVEKLVVTQNQSLQSQMYHDGRQPNSGQQQSNRRSKEKDAASEDSLTVAELGDELNEWLAEQHQVDRGNSFTAKV